MPPLIELPEEEFDELSLVWSVGLQVAREYSDEFYESRESNHWAAIYSDKLLTYIEDSMIEYHNTGRSIGVSNTIKEIVEIVKERGGAFLEDLEERFLELDIIIQGDSHAVNNQTH